MDWDSTSTRNLLVLGISLLILGASSPVSGMVWMGTLRYYFFIVGVTLIIMAVAFMIKDRRTR
jgi:hypothetical protein